MALTVEQNVLINNLMYLDSGSGLPVSSMSTFKGMSISDWISSIDMSAIDNGREYSNFTTGEEWRNIIEAVRNDPDIMSMTINEVHVDNAQGGGQGRSAVLTNGETGDAVVVFKGTQSADEWADNFTGGNVIETPQQQNALEWYQEVCDKYGLDDYNITVTGHSKGGNKAKYIAIMDGSVDNCVSFDGQGFSDQFMETYQDRIASRQDCIENHNIDYDYVNILLNDVGNTTYYQGYNIDSGGFLENHCPNTFLQFNEDGSFQMVVNPDGQPEAMQALDEFLNNCLRSMPSDQRTDTLALINTILNGVFAFGENTSGAEMADFFLQLASDPAYSDDLAYVLAYLVEYEQANPELVEQINSILGQFGLGDFTQYVDMVDAVLNFEMDTPFGTITFDSIWDFLDGVSGNIPDWLLELLGGYIEDKCGIKLTVEEMRNLLDIVRMVDENMENITVEDDGADIRVPSSGGGTHCAFLINTQAVYQTANALGGVVNSLNQIAASVGSQTGRFSCTFPGAIKIRRQIAAAQSRVTDLGNDVGRMAAALREIADLYENAENAITGNAQGS